MKAVKILLLGSIMQIGLIKGIEPELRYICPTIRPTECSAVKGPTCGFLASKVQCVKAPCTQEFVNPCFACANENVESITCGRCPIGSIPQIQYEDRQVKSKYKLPVCLDINIPNLPDDFIN